jgi:anti-sigma B factor antagonist
MDHREAATMDAQSATLEHSITKRGDVTVLAIRGRMDAVRVGGIRETLAKLPEHGHTRIVLDLSGLEWIDSSGVGALVVMFKNTKAKGGEVKAASLQRQPKEIFRLLRLETAFEVCDTVDVAVAKLSTTAGG